MLIEMFNKPKDLFAILFCDKNGKVRNGEYMKYQGIYSSSYTSISSYLDNVIYNKNYYEYRLDDFHDNIKIGFPFTLYYDIIKKNNDVHIKRLFEMYKLDIMYERLKK